MAIILPSDYYFANFTLYLDSSLFPLPSSLFTYKGLTSLSEASPLF